MRDQVLGKVPTRTAIGVNGLPVFASMPTAPPSRELVRRRLEKRTGTVTCADWTISGDNGQPLCYDGETCLFSTVGTQRYEGCGLSGRNYDWITACNPYPQTGSTAASVTYCPSSAPYCGVFEFRFDSQFTYTNIGCDTEAYTFVVTPAQTTRSVTLLTAGAKTAPADPLTDPSLPTATSKSSATSSPQTTKSPLGLYIGVAVGAAVVLALIVGLAWFCLRKRRKAKAVKELQAEDVGNTVYSQHNVVRAEMDATSNEVATPLGGYFAPPPQEKDAISSVTHMAAEKRFIPLQEKDTASDHADIVSPQSADVAREFEKPMDRAYIPPGRGHEFQGTHLDGQAHSYSNLGIGETGAFGQGRGSTSDGGVNKANDIRRQPALDMSGAPMSQDYSPRHDPSP